MSEAPISVPKAVTHKKKHWALSIVWIIPLIAALTGGWLAVSAIRSQGSIITIAFDNAEGLEAKQTRIKYKDVGIGTVQEIRLSDNHEQVIVTAQLDKEANVLLRDDTKFWIVKARVGGGGISGLSTLLSGAYIGVEAGTSERKRTEFVGLEAPLVLTNNLPGKTFLLKTYDLGSIDYGSSVYFRNINVGKVVTYHLDEDGQNVSVEIFVHAPYDQFVLDETRFWKTSSFDVSVDTEGLKLSAGSLASVVLGGITFATPGDYKENNPAKKGDVFTLHHSREEAFKKRIDSGTAYEVIFTGAVHGLSPGAPVELLGIPVGEVVSVNAAFDAQKNNIMIPVKIVLYSDWLGPYASIANDGKPLSIQERAEIMKRLVESGLRAQIRTSNLLTGRLYIMLDFFPSGKKATLDTGSAMPILPSVPGDFQNVQASLISILDKLDKLPYNDLADDLRGTLRALKETIDSAQIMVMHFDREVVPQITSVMSEAQRTLEKSNRLLAQDSPMQQELHDALREVSRAAQSVRDLTEYLSRHPEALLRGKPDEEVQ